MKRFTIRSIKLKEHTIKSIITIDELKQAMIRFYYPNMNDDEIKNQMERKLHINHIENSYGNSYTTIFSVDGSPPKGECILMTDSMSAPDFTHDGYMKGNMIFIGNGKISKRIDHIKIVHQTKFQMEVQK